MVMPVIPTAIRTARRSASLTQSDLAAKLGVTQAAVSGYEHGRAISPALLPRLSEALGMSLEALQLETSQTAKSKARRRRGHARQSLEGVRYIQYVSYYRHQAGLTLEDVATRSGLPKHVISAMESGLLAVDEQDVRILAPILCCHPEEIRSEKPGACISGGALMEEFDEAGRPTARKELTPEKHARALWELGLRDSPTVAKKPEKAKGKPPYPAGLEVEKYRRALGLTQHELAEKVGISRPALSAIENGQVPFTRAVWAALAAEFGVLPERMGTGEWQTAFK
jgi:transcriptional regulator with XRE-family HTH domain